MIFSGILFNSNLQKNHLQLSPKPLNFARSIQNIALPLSVRLMKEQKADPSQDFKALVEDIGQAIKGFQAAMAAHLPFLEQEIQTLITQKSKDEKAIETLLDTLVSLTTAGIGEPQFIRLLEYYKTVNAQYAADYWNIFEEMNE